MILAVAGVVFAALALSQSKISVGLGLIALVILGWRRLEYAPLLDPFHLLSAALLAAALILWVAADEEEGTAGKGQLSSEPAPDPAAEAMPGRRIKVANKLTSGRRMREDDVPVYLSTRPVAFCLSRGCAISGTARESGDFYKRRRMPAPGRVGHQWAGHELCR